MDNIQTGKTIVLVDLGSNRTHKGVVVQQTTTHLRVYAKETDASQLSSELFARKFCTEVGHFTHPIRIEPQLR